MTLILKPTSRLLTLINPSEYYQPTSTKIENSVVNHLRKISSNNTTTQLSSVD